MKSNRNGDQCFTDNAEFDGVMRGIISYYAAATLPEVTNMESWKNAMSNLISKRGVHGRWKFEVLGDPSIQIVK